VTALERGQCPVCGRDVALRNGGLVRQHEQTPAAAEQLDERTRLEFGWCRGSGLHVDEEVCRVCGCSYEDPCEEGCGWIADPERKGSLCSACAPVMAL
jgi:hypothetical protein